MAASACALQLSSPWMQGTTLLRSPPQQIKHNASHLSYQKIQIVAGCRQLQLQSPVGSLGTEYKLLSWLQLSGYSGLHCLKLMEYEPVAGSLTVWKLSRDMPNFPSTVLPRSFSLPAVQMRLVKTANKAGWANACGQ